MEPYKLRSMPIEGTALVFSLLPRETCLLDVSFFISHTVTTLDYDIVQVREEIYLSAL